MAKFRAIAIPVEASQWNKPGDSALVFLMKSVALNKTFDGKYVVDSRSQGFLIVEPGSWVVQSDDDVWVMSDEKFSSTYELADEKDAAKGAAAAAQAVG